MSSNSIHFIVHPLPGSDDQLIDRLKELSDKINKQGLQSAPALQSISVQQVVFGQNHIAFLLQDGRICRVYFTIYSERLNLTKNENKAIREGSLRQERLPRGLRIAESPLILIRGDDVSAMTDSGVRYSSVGSVTSAVSRTAVSNASISTTARMATRPRGRIVRPVGRGRGSGVIVGSRPLLPASVVPEELINQCQVVLQGKSRGLIIRELQRTNLDVNLAVNNLLSRDDEGDEDGDNCESYMSDDLMSLLDAGIHSDHPSVIIDTDTMFGEDMFAYSTLRGTRRRISKVEHDLDRERESIFRLRERSRWLDNVSSDEATLLRLERDRSDIPITNETKKSNLNPLAIDDELYYWLDRDGQPMKFNHVASLYSELIGVSTSGHLHQWRWCDSDPLYNENGGHSHPKAQPLGLMGEKVAGISACNVRASLWTETGKVATWADEALSRVSFKLDHPALLFSEFQLERIISLHTCNLFTCARLENNSIYWWGVLPFGQRKHNLDKMKSKNKKTKLNKENKNLTDITTGSQVCLTSSPIYQIGAIGFSVIDGIPKVGQLMKSAWSLEETCRFKIKSCNSLEKLELPLNLNSETYKPDMPPPPSPASSTCSDTSGPTVNNQLPLNRKRKHMSINVDVVEKRDEEEWPLKDVVFIEDVKTVPVGKVLKVDGSYVVVHFPLSKEISSELSGGTRCDDLLLSQLASSRILRKDELQLVKGLGPPKVPDCFQRIPKKIQITTDLNAKILTVAVDNQGIHLLLLSMNRLSYLHYNLSLNKLEQDALFPTDVTSFFGLNTALPALYGCGEVQAPLLLRDGNGAVYPLAKDCLEGIRDPQWLNMTPINAASMSINALHNVASNSKNNAAIIGLVFETQTLMPAIMKADVEKVKSILVSIENKENANHRERCINGILNERCDGNRNILHACVAVCAPISNRDGDNEVNAGVGSVPVGTVGSNAMDCGPDIDFLGPMQHRHQDSLDRHTSRLGLRDMVRCATGTRPATTALGGSGVTTDRDEIIISTLSWPPDPLEHPNISNIGLVPAPPLSSFQSGLQPNFQQACYGPQIPPSILSMPPLTTKNIDEKERKNNALSILKILFESPLLQIHLYDLLRERNADGCTPFMQSVCSRAYLAGVYILDTARRIATRESSVDRDLLSVMVFPPGSALDDSPIHIICCNDLCSFTWTGDEHINQDIFECRTCGLVGSLCCCTECARVCHKGHDCKLKKTCPTAYCDCWEKCRCRSLVAGNQTARFDLLNLLLIDTDLVQLPNSRGENILLFLLQTVGRQSVEQRQYRPTRLRTISSSPRKLQTNIADNEPEMPDHNLEPPRFSRRALERILNDWTAVKSMLMMGCKPRKTNNPNEVIFEDQVYFESQAGTAQLDKFVHCLLVKCSVEMLDCLLTTLIREMQNNRVEGRKGEARRVACRFIRSVVRIFVIINIEMTPQANKKRHSVGFSQPISKCKRAFQALISIAIEELCESADALIAPVRMGIARPTAPFSLVTTTTDAILGSEELFTIEPMLSRQEIAPSSGVTYVPYPRSPNIISGNMRIENDDEQVVVEGDMDALDNLVDDNLETRSEHEDVDRQLEHAAMQDDTVESDMELDMINDSESDSDVESNHSNLDNASVQRSAITAATAGSDAGVASLHLFSDEEDDSVDSSGQEEDSKTGDSVDNDTNVATLLEDGPMERRSSSAPMQHQLLQPPQTMLWAVRMRDSTPTIPPVSRITAPSTNSNIASASTGHMNVENAIRLRRSALSTTATSIPITTTTVPITSNQEGTVSVQATVSQLARAFGIIVRQVADLLMMLQDYHALAPNLVKILEVTNQEVIDLQMYLECRLKPTWDWLVAVMDATEAQLRFGSVISGTYAGTGGPNYSLMHFPKREVREEVVQPPVVVQMAASTGIDLRRLIKPHDANANRKDFLSYVLSLMRSHNSEHADGLPATDILSLKHVAYALDALVYYMRSGTESEVARDDVASVASWYDADDNIASSANNDDIIDEDHKSFLIETDSMDGDSDVGMTGVGATGSRPVSGMRRPYFQRSESTLFLGCSSPDPFQTPLIEALPLAEQPHLLNPYSRKEELFGMPRQTVSPHCLPIDHNMDPAMYVASSHGNGHQWPPFFDRLPTHMSLSYRCCPSFALSYQPHSTVHSHASTYMQQQLVHSNFGSGYNTLPAPNQQLGTEIIPPPVGMYTGLMGSNAPPPPSYVESTGIEPTVFHHELSDGVRLDGTRVDAIRHQIRGIVEEPSDLSLHPLQHPIQSSASSTAAVMMTSAHDTRHVTRLPPYPQFISSSAYQASVIVHSGGSNNLPVSNLYDSEVDATLPQMSSHHSPTEMGLDLSNSAARQQTIAGQINLANRHLQASANAQMLANAQTRVQMHQINPQLQVNVPPNVQMQSSVQMQVIPQLQANMLIQTNTQQQTGVQIQTNQLQAGLDQQGLAPNTRVNMDNIGASDNVSNTVVVETSHALPIDNNSRMGGTSMAHSGVLGCLVPSETLLCRWRLCLDLFGRVFSEDIGAEPGSIIAEFGGFAIKEVKFRREMERIRNSQQRDLTLEVERDRCSLLRQSFIQLNAQYHRRTTAPGPPLAAHRVKVTFKDEPGEGSGVARSFYTAFCQAVLSNENLPCLEGVLTGSKNLQYNLLQRLKSREKERRRLQQQQQQPIVLRPSGGRKSLSYDALSFYMPDSLGQNVDGVSSGAGNLHLDGSISTQRRQMGEKLFPKVHALQPSLASKITGMLLELGPSYLLGLMSSEEHLKKRVEDAVEIIKSQGSQSINVDAADSDICNLSSEKKKSGKRTDTMEEDSDAEDNQPLFWQPGKRGYYSPKPGKNSNERLNAYRNVGRIIGLCLLQNEICPLHLNRHILKYLLGRKIAWHDFAFFDPAMYESLRRMVLDSETKEGPNILAAMDLNFNINPSAEEGGGHIELIPNGDEIEVTPSNIHDYVRKYTEFKMVKAVSKPLEHLKLGVFDVIPHGSLDGLTSEDLRLLLNGMGDINTQTLINYTSFNDETSDREGLDKVQRFKRWFWSTVEKMNPSERQDLVYFWMSSPALPASEEGFQPMPSVTIRPADDNHLPTANTCISRLYIPLYSSKNILRQKLLMAIKTKNFGFV